MALYFNENLHRQTSLNEQVEATTTETSYFTTTSSYNNEFTSQEQVYDNYYNPNEQFGISRSQVRAAPPPPAPKPKPFSSSQGFPPASPVRQTSRETLVRQNSYTVDNAEQYVVEQSSNQPSNPLNRPRDNRVFGSNYKPKPVSILGPQPKPDTTRRQVSFEIDLQKPLTPQPRQEPEKMMEYENQYQPQELSYEEQMRQQQLLQQQQLQQQQQQYQMQQGHTVPQQNGGMNGHEYEELEPQEFELRPPSPQGPNERQPLVLHQGSVCQFISKNLKPAYNPIQHLDGSHLGEEKKLIDLHHGTVCQFQTSIPDFSHKSAEPSHLGEEKDLIQLHRGTVLQFPSRLPDPNQKLHEGTHLGDLEQYEHLRLKQGSVLQFPSEIHETKAGDYYKPLKEALKESLPQAEAVRQNHLLPSEARKQQTYLLHPSQNSRPPSGLSSAPGSPSMGRRRQAWPPSRHQDGRLASFIAPEGGKKTFVWPPPSANPMYGSHQDLSRVDGGHGNAASVWRPESPSTPRSYRQPVVSSRVRSVWPPTSREKTLVKQSSLPDNKSKRLIEFEEHMIYHAGVNVPVCYRVPPGTQFYETSYELTTEQ